MFYLVIKSYLTLKGKSNILFNLKENGEKQKPEKNKFLEKKKSWRKYQIYEQNCIR